MTITHNGKVVFSSREDAEKVLEALSDIIKRWTHASIEDLYDLTGLPTTHVDHQRGWTSVEGVEIKPVENGYFLDLPPAEEI